MVESSQTHAQLFDARGLADLDVVLDRTPYLDGSAVVSAANGPYVDEESPLGSGPNDRHFLVLVDQNDRATVRFGNGTSGAPPSGTISASYKTGGGAAGNVEAGSLVVGEGVFNDVHGRPVQLSGSAGLLRVLELHRDGSIELEMEGAPDAAHSAFAE